jgi:hypothetical protein
MVPEISQGALRSVGWQCTKMARLIFLAGLGKSFLDLMLLLGNIFISKNGPLALLFLGYLIADLAAVWLLL